MTQALVIDDDPHIHHLLRADFKQTEVSLLSAHTAAEGLAAVREHEPDVVILDVTLPDLSGLETFQRIRELDAHLLVIFITTSSESSLAIEAMTLGAYDYLLKPLEREKVRELVRSAIQIRRLMRTPVELVANSTASTTGDVLIGRCPAMQEVYKAIGRVAAQHVTVLIRGESGTGKELVARAIFQHSLRSDGPFLAINCAAIPETLLESELFGHERGAFTGAEYRRIGKFEQCSGGTLFLDEIGEMTPATQSKLLRVVQDHSFERLGGTETVETDVRLIAATNANLEEGIESGAFRSDLYYRLNVFTINLPPLAERLEDLPLLLDHFLLRFSRDMQKQVVGISPEALDRLLRYGWPGNVRELQSILKQALLRSAGNVLLPEFLPPLDETPKVDALASDPRASWRRFLRRQADRNSTNLYASALEIFEHEVIVFALEETGGNQLRAAELLGITRGTLRNKIRGLGIQIDQVVHGPAGEGDTDP